MKKLSWAAVTALFSALESIFNSAVSIKDNIKRLGWRLSSVLWTLAGILLLSALAFGAWKLWSTPATAVAVGPAQALAGESKQELQPKTVKVYKPSAKPKLSLPKSVQDNPAQHVLSATDIPKSKHERTLSTVLDADTGEVTTYVTEKPLPWLESTRSGSIGMYIGLKGLEPAVRAELRQDFYSIKGVQVSAIASADQTQSGRTDTFVGIGARYEW